MIEIFVLDNYIVLDIIVLDNYWIYNNYFFLYLFQIKYASNNWY